MPYIPKKKDKAPSRSAPKELPPNYKNLNWWERNLVWPFAYGGDAAMGDFFGPRGIARPATKALGLPEWQMVTPEPETGWGQFASEIPRSIITSGGMLGAASIPKNVVGGVISGYVRDPQPPDPAQPEITEHRRRMVNALLGGSGAGLGGVLGHVIGHRIPEYAWGSTIGRKGWQDLRDYVRFGEGYKGAKAMHADPARFSKSLDDFPTAKGTFRRGVRPDHPTEYAKVQGMKEGDIWEPGKGHSMDRYGPNSKEAAWGMINEADKIVPVAAKVRPGPYLHITTSNGRNVGSFRAAKWDEIITTPGAKFRVTKVIKDKNGKVTDVYLTDLSKPSASRRINDFAKDAAAYTGRMGVPAAAFDRRNDYQKPRVQK